MKDTDTTTDDTDHTIRDIKIGGWTVEHYCKDCGEHSLTQSGFREECGRDA